MDDHLTVTVNGLPTEANPGGRWLVDVGLASGPASSRSRCSPVRTSTDRSASTCLGWSRRCRRRVAAQPVPVRGLGGHHLAGGVRLDARVRGATRLAVAVAELAFVQYVHVQRWDTDGPVALRGITLSRLGTDDDPVELASRTELVDSLADHFGLDPLGGPGGRPGPAPGELAVRADEAWVAAGPTVIVGRPRT